MPGAQTSQQPKQSHPSRASGAQKSRHCGALRTILGDVELGVQIGRAGPVDSTAGVTLAVVVPRPGVEVEPAVEALRQIRVVAGDAGLEAQLIAVERGAAVGIRHVDPAVAAVVDAVTALRSEERPIVDEAPRSGGGMTDIQQGGQ